MSSSRKRARALAWTKLHKVPAVTIQTVTTHSGVLGSRGPATADPRFLRNRKEPCTDSGVGAGRPGAAPHARWSCSGRLKATLLLLFVLYFTELPTLPNKVQPGMTAASVALSFPSHLTTFEADDSMVTRGSIDRPSSSRVQRGFDRVILCDYVTNQLPPCHAMPCQQPMIVVAQPRTMTVGAARSQDARQLVHPRVRDAI